MTQRYHDRILLDVETQHDFFSPGGSCYKTDASKTAKNIYELFRWAKSERIPVISTVLRVRPGEPGPLAEVPHCVDGTEGERKLSKTVMNRRINLGLRNSTDVPDEAFDHYQQVIFEKRNPDLFHHAGAERLVTDLPLTTFVLCGAGTAQGIVKAAVGLRSRGFGVICAEDAILDLDDPNADMARRRMEAKGVVFTETARIITPATPKRVGKLRRTGRKRPRTVASG